MSLPILSSSPFFVPLPSFLTHHPLLQPPTLVLLTIIYQTKYIIFIISSFSISSLNLIFALRYLSFLTATFSVRSWPPQIVFRQITIIKVLSFVFPTKPSKKIHVWMTLLRRPPHRKTSPPCQKLQGQMFQGSEASGKGWRGAKSKQTTFPGSYYGNCRKRTYTRVSPWRINFFALEAIVLQIFEVKVTLCIVESENARKKQTWELVTRNITCLSSFLSFFFFLIL